MDKKHCQEESCKKKLGLTAFPCKCDKYFCNVHRYNYAHNCAFDFQKSGKDSLLKTMSSSVVATKIDVI